MKQLHVYGPCTGPEGYSEVTRGFIKALDARGWNVKLTPFENWGPWSVQLPASLRNVLARCTQAKLYPQTKALTHLHICLPEQVKPTESEYNINLTMFEADRVAQSWVQHLRLVDKVLVPNAFCSLIFGRSGVPVPKLDIVPLGYDPEIFNDNVPPLPLMCGQRSLSSFPIRILSVLEVTNRKNFGGLLELYFKIAANLGADNCCLVLKAVNYSTSFPLAKRVKNFKNLFVKEGRIPDVKYNVVNYAPLVPVQDMGGFMRVASHYLSASLAEGWDLNCLNAMACGVPVVVPYHSGYTAYCTQGNACLLPIARKIPAEQQGATGRLYAGASWFAPDAPEAATITIDYVRDAKETSKRAACAKEYVKQYTWDRCTERLEAFL